MCFEGHVIGRADNTLTVLAGAKVNSGDQAERPDGILIVIFTHVLQ
jgi:hypothetical protein